MNYQELANSILTLAGGSGNIKNVMACATRLRLSIQDFSKVDEDGIKALDGVAGLRKTGAQLQIIIGQQVDQVYDCFLTIYKPDQAEIENVQPSADNKGNLLSRFLTTLVEMIAPALPAIIGTGMLSAILNALTSFGLISTESTTYTIFNIFTTAALYYLPFLLANSAAKRFNVNVSISIAIAAILLAPGLATLVAEEVSSVSFFGLPVSVATYSNSLIPILLTVWIQRYFEPFLDRIIPKMLKVFLLPTVEIFVLGTLVLVVIGPAGNYLGELLGMLFGLISDNLALASLFCGALNILLITAGLHYALMPVVIANYMTLGYDNFFGGASFASNLAIAGAVFAYGVFCKDKEKRSLSISTGTTALLGITEPAIFGVALQNKRVYLSCMLAGGCAGLLSGIIGVNTYGMAPAGLAAIPILMGPTFLNGIIVIIAAFALGFAFSALATLSSKKKMTSVTPK